MADVVKSPSPQDGRSIQNIISLMNSTTTNPDHPHADLLTASADVPDLLPIHTAIASVSNKDGLYRLGLELAKFKIEVVATDGTASHLQQHRSAGLKVTALTSYTDYPENLNGRLKTLHPKIQAGVLAIRGYHDGILRKKSVQAKFIDLVIVNLYPFEQAVARNSSFFECIENIDIGGPALLRAGAKNHTCVTAICDPADYDALISELNLHEGKTSRAFRRKCAQKVFELTSSYDQAIAAWFEKNKKPE